MEEGNRPDTQAPMLSLEKPEWERGCDISKQEVKPKRQLMTHEEPTPTPAHRNAGRTTHFQGPKLSVGTHGPVLGGFSWARCGEPQPGCPCCPQ